jgi:hypothetical protein
MTRAETNKMYAKAIQTINETELVLQNNKQNWQALANLTERKKI